MGAVWIAITIVTSFLICAAVVTLYHLQDRALARSAEVIRDLRQARLDLSHGLVHAAAGGAADSPWQREQGLALLMQALAEFEASLRALPPGAGSADDFTDQLLSFRTLLTGEDGPRLDPSRAVELRTAFHRLDTMAGRIDVQARKGLLAIREEHRLAFWIVLAGSAGLLALISTGMVRSGRRQAAAEAARVEAVRQAEVGYERFEKIFDAVPIATNIVTLDEGRFLAANDAYCRLYGYAREELIGRTVAEIGIWAEPAHREAFLRQLRAERRVTDYEARFKLRSGETRDGRLSAELIEFLGRPCLLAIMSNVTERKRYEARIEYLATHDGLTDLPNRTLIHDRITQAISHARRAGRQLAVMYIDLDRFKVVNDGLGHAFGDALLKAAGERLARVVRDGDTVARQSGDEFIVLLADLRRSADVYIVTQKVLEAFAQAFRLDAREIHLAASVGVSLFPQDGQDAGTLIGNADVAMYRAKELGGNTYQFFTREMSDETRRRVGLETQLRLAVPRGQLHLAYQPKVDLATGRIAGCEALAALEPPASSGRCRRRASSRSPRNRADRADRRMGAAHRLRAEQGLAGRGAAADRRLREPVGAPVPAAGRGRLGAEGAGGVRAAAAAARAGADRKPDRAGHREGDRRRQPAQGGRACSFPSTISAPAIPA